MKHIESAGKTREEAIENGLKELGVDMHDLEKIDVVDEGSKGFLGIGARPVRVRLSVDRPDTDAKRGDRQRRQGQRDGDRKDTRRGGGSQDRQESRRGGGNQDRQDSRRGGGQRDRKDNRASEDKDDRSGNRRKKKRKRGGGQDKRNEKNAPEKGSAQQQKGNAHKAAPIVDKKNNSVTDEATEALRRVQEFDNDVPAEDNKNNNELPPDARTDDDIETITDAQGKEAAAMLSEVLDLMGLNGEVSFKRVSDGSARLVIDSEEDSGILIGKRGVTLHAIQYLVNRMIAQHDAAENSERVMVDVGGYVDRRRNTLADMARTMAKRAKDSGRNVRLKPLSPQERRIVHLTLESDPAVRTYSLGDSLFRSIVINPVDGRGDSNRNRRERGRNRDRQKKASTSKE